jgi:hypothetical protein
MEQELQRRHWKQTTQRFEKGTLMKSKYIALCSGLLAAAVAGCGGGGNSDSPQAPGTVRVAMADAPACGYDHVFITVSKVGINSHTDGSGDWTDITLAKPQKIDLLSLTNGVLETLGETALPAGSYQQLRLVLLPNTQGAAVLSNSVVPSGQTAEVALKTPSAQESGIKVNTRGPFTVASGTLVDLVLDFNACKSIVTNGRSKGGSTHSATGFLLKPVITATPVVVSGAIDGYVDGADATTTSGGVTVPGAQVFAEQDGVIVRGTVADSSGHFVLSPLEQSAPSSPGSPPRNYDVVIVNNGKASDVISSVPVVAQATTTLSTSAVPFTLDASPTGVVDGTVNVAANASLEALQMLNGVSYILAETNADGSTGAYDFTLPTAAPELAPYSSTLPIVPAPVAAAAGLYTISATSEAGNTLTANATVTAGGTTTVDFTNLQ